MGTPAQYKKRKERLLAAGLCGACGKRPPRDGRKLCKACAAYFTKRNKTMAGDLLKRAKASRRRACDKYIAVNREAHNARFRKRGSELRKEALAAYGSKCACCSETQFEFLQLDHVNNDGAKHRLEVGTGRRLLAWLKKRGYPDIIQILCANCNAAKAFYGECPHIRKNREANETGTKGCKKRLAHAASGKLRGSASCATYLM